jgi:hypothetical protein
LIRLFGFYLAALFVIGLVVRIRDYRTMLALVATFKGRWPRLYDLVKQHRGIFLTWGTVLPLLLTLGLLLIHTVATQFIWPHANLTLDDLLRMTPALLVVSVTVAAMVAFDVWSLCRASTIDRAALEKNFDQAEYWLKSWTAPVVRVLSLGYINPRRIVTTEVRKALEMASGMLNSTLWWISLQTGLRISCGLSLWGSWALS